MPWSLIVGGGRAIILLVIGKATVSVMDILIGF